MWAKRIRFSDVITIVFMIFLTFNCGITLDLSTAGEKHIFFVKWTEIFGLCAWLYIVWIFLCKKRKFSKSQLVYLGFCILFACYYVCLMVVRYYLGTNVTDSLDLFRSIVTLSPFFLLITLNQWSESRILHLMLGYFAALSIGWTISVIVSRNFSARFPDYPMTYIAFASVMIPLLLFVLIEKGNKSLTWDEPTVLVLLVVTNVFLFFSASRLAFVVLFAVWILGILLFGYLKKEHRKHLIQIAAVFLFSAVVSAFLYGADVFYCRSSVARVVPMGAAGSYIPQSSDNGEYGGSVGNSLIGKEGILQDMQSYMEKREELYGTGQDVGATFHNPVVLSNGARMYYYLQAIEQLHGDWLFSLKGQTAFEVDLYGTGEITRSGTHNLFLDYTLSFGIVGTGLLICMFLAPTIHFFYQIRDVKNRSRRWRMISGFTLTIGCWFSFAMVQATASSLIPLALLIFLLAFWYQMSDWSVYEGKKICMLVTSGVVNDSRVIREANLAAESGFETLMLGRLVPELGEPDSNWKFSCQRIAIPRAAQSGVMGKIAERVRIGLSFTLNAVRFRPDLIHCNDFDTLPFGYLAAMICDSALIYDSHELWSENELAGRSALGKRLVKLIEGFLAQHCDGVISVSNAAGTWLRDIYDLKNLIVVTNCPKIGAVEQQPKSERFELLCHGMFAPDRGYEELIDCAALVESHDIQVRMRGYGIRTQEYRERAARTGQKNIVFSQKVPSDQVCSAASASHVGIALTRPVSKSYELTVSNKLFEYLAAGLPVILSDVPEHRMLNERYHFGMILDKMTPEALAEAAIRLKEDPALYQELRENAMLASRELCFEKEGEKLISLYRMAIRNRFMEDQEYETSFA